MLMIHIHFIGFQYINDLTKMLTMLALAAAIIKRIGHAVLQYLLTSIAY
jgi:hypothetical protein